MAVCLKNIFSVKMRCLKTAKDMKKTQGIDSATATPFQKVRVCTFTTSYWSSGESEGYTNFTHNFISDGLKGTSRFSFLYISLTSSVP